jgi:hypothetical protein
VGVELVVKKDNWAKIRANLSLAKKSYVAVGWPSGKASTNQSHGTDGMTNVQVAVANELGSAPGVLPVVSARPMVGTLMRYRATEFKRLQKELLAMISRGEVSTKIALDRIGIYGANELKELIKQPGNVDHEHGRKTTGWKVKNCDITIALKSRGDVISDIPLIDTGHMLKSVSWKVHMRSGVAMHTWQKPGKVAPK